MFTGIVQSIGVVRESKAVGLDLELRVDASGLKEHRVGIGDSVAIDGVCLTVVDTTGGCFRFIVSGETISRSLLGAKVSGDRVNLELALLPTTRLGGHIVTGHVDGIGRLDELELVGLSKRMKFSAPPELMRFIAEKGSVCIDGVSLTVNSVTDGSFEVNIVPHTTEVTTMMDYSVGTRVHLEVDIIARYLHRFMTMTKSEPPAATQNPPEAITHEFLTGKGFVAPDLDE